MAKGSWRLVPSELFNHIRQSAVPLSSAKNQAAAKAFLAFLKHEKARAVINGFGYDSAAS
ncbi:MAG: substrate-binding domain-containing protein [Gallionellaceae bacterium]